MGSSAALQHTILTTSICSKDNTQKPTFTTIGPSEKETTKSGLMKMLYQRCLGYKRMDKRRSIAIDASFS